MENIEFHGFNFHIENEKIRLGDFAFVQVQIAGHDHICSDLKARYCSEFDTLKYKSHTTENNVLTIEQENDSIAVKTVFKGYDDSTAISCYTEVENISDKPIVLEQVSSLYLDLCIPRNRIKDSYLYPFIQGHHGECQPRRISLFEAGICDIALRCKHRVSHANVGSWSTKEALPQGIIESNGRFTMFQIESNNSWYYEISDDRDKIYLYLGGGSCPFCSWAKKLESGEKYRTKGVAVCYSDSLNGVVGEMTKYRRHIAGQCKVDDTLPSIFNEYMHLSWDSPSEENVRKYAPVIADMGVEYYVIDCGWHDEEPGYMIYPYVGKWVESKTRFPNGVRATTDYIRSLGMKAGLWIEPEIVGKLCKDMIEYYGDECFVRRYGEKVCTMNRLFLDFRNEKVISYMSDTIRRMVNEYGADYIKLDYNEDMGLGCDVDATSLGEGLENCAAAYLNWIDSMRAEFPDVLFETCSSGGMRMDYQTMQHFSIVSTSDQTRYIRYPYIASNMPFGMLPEQAAVWSYPVNSLTVKADDLTEEWVQENISREEIVMNMINSFLGRMHLASHIDLMNDEQKAIVKEGVAYYKKLAKNKKEALPFFPIGFITEGQELIASGLKADGTLYLAVWNMGDAATREIPVGNEYSKAVCGFPLSNELPFDLKDGKLTVDFTQKYQARFFEIK